MLLAAGIVITGLLALCRDNRREQPNRESPGEPVAITIDYPAEGSIFPPEFPAPTWLWRDAADQAASWEISITFADGSSPAAAISAGERMRIGEIDPRCVSSTNKPPALTPEQAAAHTWTPDSATGPPSRSTRWTGRRRLSSPDIAAGDSKKIVSRGQVSIRTSRDPVGAPIFYRDVPLMPSENEKGVIKPLAPQAVPLIAWRLRSVADKESRVLMEGPAHLRELPFLLRRRQDARHGHGRPEKRQRAVRNRQGPAADVDSQRGSGRMEHLSRESWGASCGWGSCPRFHPMPGT